MCICFFQVNHPKSKYPFIFCGNRDEFLTRESVVCHEWNVVGKKHTRIFGGLDAVRGGTWLACSSTASTNSFRFAVVHNIRRNNMEIDQSKNSRGDLPKDFLTGRLGAREYAEKVNREGDKYFGFTMVIADEHGVYFTSNANSEVLKLKEGVYSISNALLDTPWPKVVLGKDLFRSVLANAAVMEEEDRLVAALVSTVLKDPTLFPFPLPGMMDAKLEVLLSSINVTPFQWGELWGLYGTRMHTVFLARRDASVRIIEHSIDTNARVKDWNAKWTCTEFDTSAPATAAASHGKL